MGKDDKIITDAFGNDWNRNEVYDFYKHTHVMPLIKQLELEVSQQINEFEKTTGISVFLSPILVWDQSYQAGCELILKSLHPLEKIGSLP